MIFGSLAHCGTVPLETERLLLRRLTPEDAPSMHKNWASDALVYKYMTSSIMPELADVEQFIARKLTQYDSPQTYYWGVFWKETGENIGMATFTEIQNREKCANIAYSISRRFWHRGIAHEAAEAILALAFDRIGFRKIVGSHFSDNAASGKVMLACGMHHLGRSRTTVYHRGDYLFFDSYAITAHQYRANRENRKFQE